MIRASFVSLLAVTIAIVCGGLNPAPANAINPVLSISFGLNTDVEPGFTRIHVADSGSIVNGIKITLELMMPPVAGNWTPAWNERNRGTAIPNTVQWYRIYRGELFVRPGGIRIRLEGLEPSTPYQLEIWDYSSGSASNRIADVNANDVYCMTIRTNNANPPVTGEENHYWGECSSDPNGGLRLELWPNPATDELAGSYNPYAIINAFRLTPINVSPIATNPVPATGSTIYTTQPDFQWEPGFGAASHNVYLGTDYNAVRNATKDTPLGVLVAQGIEPNSYDPGVLQADTTYYWRIDEVKGSTIQTGNVWNFHIPPKTAYNPSPVDGALFADPNFLNPTVILSWYRAADATSYHVYFGDDLQNVQAGTAGTDKGPRTDPNYSPGVMLELNKTYYWRVDAIEGTTTHLGAVWSFKTSGAGLGTVRKDIWENVTSGNNLNVLKNDPRYPDSPTVTQTLTSFDTGPDGYAQPNYGGRLSGWLYVPLTGNYTFWLSSAGQGELWLSTDEDADNLMPQYIDRETVWGGPGGYSFAHSSNPIPLIGGNKYYIEAIWVSVDWDFCQVAWQGTGIRDQQIIQGSYLSPYAATSARSPRPGSGATDISDIATLRWRAGEKAVQHNVYFGTDANAVAAATPATAGIFRSTQTATRYVPTEEPLVWGQTCYWRVDEVNSLDSQSPWPGKVWSFTVGNYAGIDDFESYDQVCDKIWYTWRDGLTFDANSVCGVTAYSGNGTGSIVDPNGSIVRSGVQSMQFTYNNMPAPNYSELRREWASPQDWTRKGVKSLGLWFRGTATNYFPGALYIVVEDSSGQSKTLTNADPNAVSVTTWREWNIDLREFAGINLSSIKRMMIGLDNRANVGAAGIGVMYFDDIRLYPPRCVASLLKPARDLNNDCIVDYRDVDLMATDWLLGDQVIATTSPGTTGLAALYAMEDNVADTSGNNRNGTANGDPVFVASATGLGKALSFDGTDDYVDLPIGTVVAASSSMTVASWVNFPRQGGGYQRIFDFGNDTNVYMFLTPRQGTTGAMRFAITTSSTAGESGLNAPSTLATGWHHVAVVIDGTAPATMRLYLDGIVVATGTTNRLPRDLGQTTQNWLGRSQWPNDAYLTGSLDDFRIYSRALSGAEVAYLADTTPGDGQLIVPVQSVAELYTAEPAGSQRVNFRDYAVLAAGWLEEKFWPQP